MESIGRSVNNTEERKYLDISKLPEGIVIDCIAYVHDVSLGMSRMENGFVKFFLKDCNANIITATLFDVEDFMMSGAKVATFKHKAVEFKCVAQEFRGRTSLVIDGKEGIKLYDGKFDYSRFIGKVSFDLTDFRECCMNAGLVIDEDGWSTATLEEMCRGKSGAYGRFVELAFGTCKPIYTELEPDAGREFIKVFGVVAMYYYQYLKMHQNTEVIGSVGVYDVIARMTSKYANDDSLKIYIDTLSAVVGADKPRHLYAHLIRSAFENAKWVLTLQAQYQTMPQCTKAYIGGVELSKY